MTSHRTRLYGIAISILVLITAACSSISHASTIEVIEPTVTRPGVNIIATGNPVIGESLFHGQMKIKGVVACSMCHYIQPDQRILVGPNLDGVFQEAGNRVPEMSAVEYIRRSIREPEEYMVDGFPIGTMNEKYDSRLSEDHVNDIIAYLMTL